MGCDIHLVLERKNDAGKWVGVDTFNSHASAYGESHSVPVARSRNYERFAALAGVRGDGPEPRGLPSDASDTTRLLATDDWGADGHSHSHLPLGEAAKIFLQTEFKKPQRTSLAMTDPAYHYFGVDPADGYRIVFWFDN